MNYIKRMLENEEAERRAIEEIMDNKDARKIVLRAGHYVDNNTIYNLRGTKALMLEYMSNTDKEYDSRESWGELLLSAHERPMGTRVTTWSSLVRNAIDVIRPQLEYVKGLVDFDEFRATFDRCLNGMCLEQEFRLNSNCPRRLYTEAEETDLIHSSVYMNNKNHFIPIATDEQGVMWGLCAVYTGEIIIMLETLLNTIHSMMEEYRADKDKDVPYHTMVITYINRADLSGEQNVSAEEVAEMTSEVESIDEEIQKLRMGKDIIFMQDALMQISIAVQRLEEDIAKFQEKYSIPTVDDLLSSKNGYVKKYIQ